jgi:hypothetical protein
VLTCMKLSAILSARRIARAFPEIVPNSSPLATVSPSRLDHRTASDGSHVAKTASATASPARMPPDLARNVAVAVAFAGML